MASGGYGFTKKTANTIPIKTDKSVVENLDLNEFTRRVDLAVAKEKRKNDSIKNITDNLALKNNWEIAGFSSQETTGEGAVNGRAATTIDGNVNTFWHSAWQSGSASFPHHITVNMNKIERVTGFLFQLSGGTSRHQKDIELWGSTDGKNFELMLATTAPDSEKYYIKLPQTWAISHFKLVIKNSYTGVVHCRINEIDVSLDTSTGVETVLEEQSKLLSIFPNPVQNVLNFSYAKNVSDINATVVDANGKTVISTAFNETSANQLNSLDISKLNAGVYMLNLKKDNQAIAVKTFIKK